MLEGMDYYGASIQGQFSATLNPQSKITVYGGLVRESLLLLRSVLRFLTDIWHPNIEKDGKVCISILHEPGDDRFGYEKASGTIGASQ